MKLSHVLIVCFLLAVGLKVYSGRQRSHDQVLYVPQSFTQQPTEQSEALQADTKQLGLDQVGVYPYKLSPADKLVNESSPARLQEGVLELPEISDIPDIPVTKRSAVQIIESDRVCQKDKSNCFDTHKYEDLLQSTVMFGSQKKVDLNVETNPLLPTND